jgi:hypothetical protein
MEFSGRIPPAAAGSMAPLYGSFALVELEAAHSTVTVLTDRLT